MVSSPTPTNRVDLARAAIVLGTALVVAVLTAIGIQGDLLARALRNFPEILIVAFALVIVGLSLPFFYTGSDPDKKLPKFLSTIGLSCVCLGIILALALGGISSAEREQPSLTIAAAPDNAHSSRVTVTVTATANSLRADEDALLRVVGLKSGAQIPTSEACRATATWGHGESTVLSWGTSGPDLVGKATLTSTIAVSAHDFGVVCAYVGLRDRDTRKVTDDRFSWTFVDLSEQAFPDPSPSPTP